MDGTILIADDDKTIRTVLTQALTRAGCKVHATGSLATLMLWVEEGRGDMVITDVIMPDGNGLERVPEIATLRPQLPVIVISAQNTIMTAIQANEAAAFDYVPKPFDLPDLMHRCARALAAGDRRSPSAPPTDTGHALPIVGRAPVMQDLYRIIARILNAELPVMISGETGSGKSLIARVIHDYSDRRARPFVLATTGDLLDEDGQIRIFRRAGSGTILFDEISDLPRPAQIRLVQRLNALSDPAPRLMTISQQHLNPRSGEQGIHDDLYYRLNGVALHIPPLRERIDDVVPLSEFFLNKAASQVSEHKTLGDAAGQALRAANWPGNVRQLQNCIQQLILICDDDEITVDAVNAALGTTSGPHGAGAATQQQPERLSGSIEAHLRRYFDLHGGDLPAPGLYNRILTEMERPLIAVALESCRGNQAKCAQLLGINRNTLRKKLTELDIRVTRRQILM